MRKSPKVFYVKNTEKITLTKYLQKNTNHSIMLTIDFQEKSLETFFYKIRFWTFISCPFFEKIILSFKTCFLKIL